VNKIKMPLAGPATSPVNLQMFLDGSVLEIFANGTTSITARVYEIPSGPLRPKLEGNAKLMAFDAWQMTNF
jgi:hypothetical protein